MDLIDIQRQTNNQFFSREKTPVIVVAIPEILTVDIENDYVVIAYIGTDGVETSRAFRFEGAPNQDPLSLDNEQFYIDAILAV